MSTITIPERETRSPFPPDETLEPVEVEANVILERGEAWMREHGWTRCAFERHDGAVCLVGALIRGAGFWSICEFGRPPMVGVGGLAYAVAERKLNKATGRISTTAWNDTKCRSEAEALAVLRRARTQPSE